jgi:hypothetical protein
LAILKTFTRLSTGQLKTNDPEATSLMTLFFLENNVGNAYFQETSDSAPIKITFSISVPRDAFSPLFNKKFELSDDFSD